MSRRFSKILIANRGEIACRVMRTAKRMGFATVAVHSDADADALHVELADEAVHIGASPVGLSYLSGERIIKAALDTGAQAIHPGYGFLSENPGFVDAVTAAGLVFIGPSAGAIRAMGLKDAAKDLMVGAGVPVVPGYQGEIQDPAFLAQEAERIGYPVLIKARAGGGGKGMRKVERAQDFADALLSAQREGQASFGDPNVLIEKFVSSPRHIEVQVFGDSHGNVVHMFERDCSLQRRHQKVIEEAPAPGMSADLRQAMCDAAVKAAKAIDYCGAGTIEFIVDGSGPLRPDGFWFMEMNTRLQVEHPVTEAITGLDLVEWQFLVASGEPLPLGQDDIRIDGHAFEARLYAEDPANGFLPATGVLAHLGFAQDARNDSGVRSGDRITPFYDPMIAKVIVHSQTRDAARKRLVEALKRTHVAGTRTNAEFLVALAQHEGFAGQAFDTGLIERDLERLVSSAGGAGLHMAVAAAFELLAAVPGRSTASPFIGWRLWGEAAQPVRLFHEGAISDLSVTVHDASTLTVTCPEGADVLLADVKVDGTSFRARTGPSRRLAEATVTAMTHQGERMISVLCEGAVRDFVCHDGLASKGEGDSLDNVVTAPMTGLVVHLSVRAGDRVEAGERLGVLEAMKMETNLVAPRAGTVAEVLCSAGASVEGGSVLATLVELGA